MEPVLNVSLDDIASPLDVQKLSDEELLLFHLRLHQWDATLREKGAAREYRTINRHVWVVQEMRRRGMNHNEHDELDRDSRPFLDKSACLSWLERLLEQAGDAVLVPHYVSLVGSAVFSDDPHDIDVLVREDPTVAHHGWRESVLLLARKVLDPEKTGKQLHLLFNPQGPHRAEGQAYVPLFDLVLRPHRPLEPIDCSELRPLMRYPVQKPAMVGSTDFFSSGEAWERWAEKAVAESGVVYASPKVDGFRLILSRSGDDVRVWLEDTHESLDGPLARVARELPDGTTVEGELAVLHGERWLARPQIPTFLRGNIDGEPYVFLYDLTVWDGEDVHDWPFSERLELLQSIDAPHAVVLPQVPVRTRDELESAADVLLAWTFRGDGPPIEGVVLRRGDAPYVFGPTSTMAKFKVYFELKVKVVAVDRTENGWVYTGALRGSDGQDVVVGRTFVSDEKLADVGDTLNVRVEELVVDDEGRISWGKPTPLGVDRTRPAYTVEQALDMAERSGTLKRYVVTKEETHDPGALVKEDGEDDEPRSAVALRHWEERWHEAMPLSGEALPWVLHAHVRGLSGEEAERIVEGEWTLDDVVRQTDHAIHFDLRLATDRFDGWWGVTLFGGSMEENREQLRPFQLMDDSDLAIQSSPKLFGPLSWLQVGVDKPFVVKPRGVGSTSRTWAAFWAVDRGTYRLGFARVHAVEIFLEGKVLEGRFLWQYAPLGEGRREWLFTRPADQTPYAAMHDRDAVIRELRQKGQRYLVWPKDPRDLRAGHELIDVAQILRIVRRDPEKRYTLAVAYPLREVDSWGDVITDPEQLEEAAWNYMRKSRRVGLDHAPGTEGAGTVVESYIYRGPRWEVNGEVVEPGDWLLGIVWTPQAWERIKRGEKVGLSIQGWAHRRKRREEV
jgi:hypothetical protein